MEMIFALVALLALNVKRVMNIVHIGIRIIIEKQKQNVLLAHMVLQRLLH